MCATGLNVRTSVSGHNFVRRLKMLVTFFHYLLQKCAGTAYTHTKTFDHEWKTIPAVVRKCTQMDQC